MTGGPATVLVIAAYPAARAGLAALLSGDPALRPVADFAPGAPPAAVVADLGGTEDAAAHLAETWPGVPLVLLGAIPAADGPGLASQPVAWLARDADGPALVAAVRAVLAGLTVLDPAVAGASRLHVHPHAHAHATARDLAEDDGILTAREREVLALVADGLPNKAIAHRLGISEHTVKFHVGSLLQKLDAGSRTEAAMVATRRGLLAV